MAVVGRLGLGLMRASGLKQDNDIMLATYVLLGTTVFELLE